MTTVTLLPGAISELYVYASITGTLTLADRYAIMVAILDNSLTEEEQLAVDRLLYAFRKGKIQLVNELSAML